VRNPAGVLDNKLKTTRQAEAQKVAGTLGSLNSSMATGDVDEPRRFAKTRFTGLESTPTVLWSQIVALKL